MSRSEGWVGVIKEFSVNPVLAGGLLVLGLAFAGQVSWAQDQPAQTNGMESVSSTKPIVEDKGDTASSKSDPPDPSKSDPAPTDTADPIEPAGKPNRSVEIALDPASLVPDLPPIPPAKATLIGGTIERMDPVDDEVTIHVFGGGKMKALFDPRTHVYRNGKPASTEDLKTGQRIYADTILLNGAVFALNIRLGGSSAMGESRGVVVSYRPEKNILVLRDLLAPNAMNLRLTPDTRVVRGEKTVAASELTPGTLVTVSFLPEPGNQPVAREVSILITPGTEFSFMGQVTALDLHVGLLVVTSSADHKTYELHFNPSIFPVTSNLRQGAEVTVLVRYDGNQYVARNVVVN